MSNTQKHYPNKAHVCSPHATVVRIYDERAMAVVFKFQSVTLMMQNTESQLFHHGTPFPTGLFSDPNGIVLDVTTAAFGNYQSITSHFVLVETDP